MAQILKNKQGNILLIIILLFCILFQGCKQESTLKINEIQILGSHNSYTQRIQKELWNIVYSQDSVSAMQLDYGHISLIDQLNVGLRGLELDVFYDPEGGRYAKPLGQQLILEQNEMPQDFDIEEKMRRPGLKVFHVQDIDFRK